MVHAPAPVLAHLSISFLSSIPFAYLSASLNPGFGPIHFLLPTRKGNSTPTLCEVVRCIRASLEPGAHCVGERSSEPVPRLNSEFLRSNRLAMPVSSYLVDFVFWQALYGRWCPVVMSTMSRLMSRFVRDNQQDIGVRLMPTCAHGFAQTVVISVELRSIATDRAAKLDCRSRAY